MCTSMATDSDAMVRLYRAKSKRVGVFLDQFNVEWPKKLFNIERYRQMLDWILNRDRDCIPRVETHQNIYILTPKDRFENLA